MKIPYTLQGALFAPTCAALIFALKVTCPAPTGAGCFADPFLTPVFLPLPFLYKVLGHFKELSLHEPSFILGYWTLVGLLAGIATDIYRSQKLN